MNNNLFIMSLITDIQTDIEYLKKVTHKLQEAVEELQEENARLSLNEKVASFNKKCKELQETKEDDIND